MLTVFPNASPVFWFAVIFGEGAGGYLDAYPVTDAEFLAGIPGIQIETVNPSGLDQRRFFAALTIPRSHHPVRQSLSEAVLPHIDQFHHEVRIHGGR